MKFTPEAGIYQASERLGNLSNHGLDFTMRSNDGELVMGQVGWEPTFCEAPGSNLGLPGDYIGIQFIANY